MDPLTLLVVGVLSLETIVSQAERFASLPRRIGALADTARRASGFVTGLSTGSNAERKLHEASAEGHFLTRISEHGFVDQDLIEVVNRSGGVAIRDAQQLQLALRPLTASMSSQLYFSQVSSAPSRIIEHLRISPERVLEHPHPLGYHVPQPSPNHIPILVMEKGRPIVGWQLRAVVSELFGCEFRPGGRAAQAAVDDYGPGDIAAELDAILVRSGIGKDFVHRFGPIAAAQRSWLNRNSEKEVWMGIWFRGEMNYVKSNSASFTSDKFIVECDNTGVGSGARESISLQAFLDAEIQVRGFLSPCVLVKSNNFKEKLSIIGSFSNETVADTLRFVQARIKRIL